MSDRCKTALRCAAMLAILFAIACLLACQKEPTVTPPPPSVRFASAAEVDPAECNKPASPGNKQDYAKVACPEACKATSVTDHSWVVDDYVDVPTGQPIPHEADPDICLHGTGDTVTYLTKKANRKIQIMRFVSGTKDAYPFLDTGSAHAPPYPQGGAAQSATTEKPDPNRAPKHSAEGKCFVFHAYIKVIDNNGTPRCFDPHIYTDCFDSSCFSREE